MLYYMHEIEHVHPIEYHVVRKKYPWMVLSNEYQLCGNLYVQTIIQDDMTYQYLIFS